MSYSIIGSTSKKSNEFVHDMWMEVSNLVYINNGLTLRNYQNYIYNMNDTKKDSFFKKVFKILFEFAKPDMTKSNFQKIVIEVNKILNVYPKETYNLSDDNIKIINGITDELIFNVFLNKGKYNLSDIKENLIEKNIKNEQIDNALIWICLRISCFLQCYALNYFEETCYK